MKDRIFKFFFLSVGLTVFSLPVISQYSSSSYKDKDFIKFFTTKTMVVLDTNETYNEAIKKSMKENWTVTEYDFITREEFKSAIGNLSLSFIMPVVIDQFISSGFTNSTGGTTRTGCFLVCVLGGGKLNKKGITNYRDEDFIGYVPIDYAGMENPPQYSAWRMPFMIIALQNAIQIIKTKKMDASYSLTYFNFDPYYGKKSGTIKRKTLLIPEDYLKGIARKYKDRNDLFNLRLYGSPIDGNTISEYYKYRYKIATRDEIIKAMADKREDVCILFKAASSQHFICVYDPSVQEVVYSYVLEGEGVYLGKADFKLISKGYKE